MTDRFRAMQRVLKVQTQLHRLAQWKLAGLEQQEDALEKRQDDLLRFLDEEKNYTALLSETLMRRLHTIGEEKAKLLVAREEQSNKTLEESRRVGRMQRMVDDLAEEARRQDDRDEMRDILEQINQNRKSKF